MAGVMNEIGQNPNEVKLGKLLLGNGSNSEGEDIWDDSCASIDIILNKLKNKPTYWNVEVKNFGWSKLNGHKAFRAENGRAILMAILPETSCSFKIYRYGSKGFAINNAHHDSPTWDEWYYITPRKSS